MARIRFREVVHPLGIGGIKVSHRAAWLARPSMRVLQALGSCWRAEMEAPAARDGWPSPWTSGWLFECWRLVMAALAPWPLATRRPAMSGGGVAAVSAEAGAPGVEPLWVEAARPAVAHPQAPSLPPTLAQPQSSIEGSPTLPPRVPSPPAWPAGATRGRPARPRALAH